VLYRSSGWISDVRISPDGGLVAFIDHPIVFDSRGSVQVADSGGKVRTLTGVFSDVLGLAWNPTGKEIWFTGSYVHLSSNLYAVSLSGRQRLVWAGAGEVVLQDISREGHVLFIRQNRRRGIAGLFPGHRAETDLSWQDWSLPMTISPDGKWVFFSEEGDGGGPKYSAYMRNTDGSPAVRLGDGGPVSLSPDGKWVASLLPGEPQHLVLLPTRAGEVKDVSQPGFNYQDAQWLPDGKRLLVGGNEPGKPSRSYLQDAAGGPLSPVTPEGSVGRLAPDGKSVRVRKGDDLMSYPLDGGQPAKKTLPLAGMRTLDVTPDGRYLFGTIRSEVPLKVYRFDTTTGEKKLWKELAPVDLAGVYNLGQLHLTPDGSWYVYSYVRDLSDLYMAEDLR